MICKGRGNGRSEKEDEKGKWAVSDMSISPVDVNSRRGPITRVLLLIEQEVLDRKRERVSTIDAN